MKRKTITFGNNNLSVSFCINLGEGESAWAYPAGRGDPASLTLLSILAELGSLGCAGIKVLRTALEIHPKNTRLTLHSRNSSQNFMVIGRALVHWYHKLFQYGICPTAYRSAGDFMNPTVNYTTGEKTEIHYQTKQRLCSIYSGSCRKSYKCLYDAKHPGKTR